MIWILSKAVTHHTNLISSSPGNLPQ